jgi:hypothetical protein
MEMGEASMSSGGDSDLTRLCSLIPSSSAMLSLDGEWSRLFCGDVGEMLGVAC